ncbi:MAG: hypothetical protein HY704_17725 [Gemmatimonadetes bacterium]|nr:hypothetical protein [Gemmatimonadota bacterium]
MSGRTHFWVTALAAAAVVAGGTAAGVPLLVSLELRDPALVWLLPAHEIWLLAVFTEGALAVLLGGAALGGWLVRAPGVRDALEARAGGLRAGPEESGARPALWVAAVGGCLLGIYLVGWLLLREL